MLSLSRALVDLPDCNVAIRGKQTLTSAQFINNVSAWLDTLSPISGQRFVVYHRDPFEFLSILYALWQINKVACIVGDNLPATLNRLTNKVDGFIGEINAQFEGGIDNTITIIKKPKQAHINSLSFTELNHLNVAVELYTSGSSGQPKAIQKTLQQLENELFCLQQQWPSTPGAVVLSTVSHQHAYGLTFRLLRPFCSGQIIHTTMCEYTEDIYRLGSIYQPFVLVSSPTHISRLNTLLEWTTLNNACLNVFSAAAPLAKADALRLSDLLNTPLWEIYGSSETGVIAWRRQTATTRHDYWTCFASVKVHIANDKSAIVSSSFTENLHPMALSDKLESHGSGQFSLKGRSDNIVKVEGKRVSLTRIEKTLLKHALIEQVKVILINRNRRSELAVVLKLNTMGERQLMLLGRQKLIKILRHHLATEMEVTLVPRRWRFVEAMPYNQQGKITQESLQKIVEQSALVKWPKIQNVTTANNTVTIKCEIQAELIYFDGHFASAPVLPGVVQVHWAHKLALEYFDITSDFSHLEVIKFSHIIQPGNQISIDLKYNKEKQKVTFTYSSNKTNHASGRICFAAA